MGNPATGEPSGTYRRKSLMDTMAVAARKFKQGGKHGVGALTGWFWGLLFGLIFFVPILGLAIGAGLGALAASMSDVGISDDFIRRVRAEVTPGTSALFAYTSGAVVDKVHAAMKPHDPTLLTSNLSADQEKRLREAFAEEAG